jgi:hypothetical protein
MTFISKKSMIGLATGIAILAGTMSPFIVEAAPQVGFDDGGQPTVSVGQPRIDRDKLAQKLSDTCGVDKQEVIGYLNIGVSFKELSMGSFVAKASGKSLKEVMDIKMKNSNWRDVIQFLGITKEQMKATHNDLVSTLFNDKLNIPKQTSLSLLEKGYQARDIAMANELANDTDKPINDVLAMRQLTNTWKDVADSLGVSDEMFKEDMENIHSVLLPHGGFYEEK